MVWAKGKKVERDGVVLGPAEVKEPEVVHRPD